MKHKLLSKISRSVIFTYAGNHISASIYLSCIVCIMGISIGSKTFSQPTETYNHFRVESENTYTLIQCLGSKKPDIIPLPDKTYAWYNKGPIHHTQAGYSGYLLNGKYEEFSHDGMLVQKGEYDMGLKNNTWQRWQSNGLLLETINYSQGKLHGETIYYNQNGEKHKTVEYKNGLLNGDMIIYQSDTVFSHKKYRSGRLIRVDGVPVGEKESVHDE